MAARPRPAGRRPQAPRPLSPRGPPPGPAAGSVADDPGAGRGGADAARGRPALGVSRTALYRHFADKSALLSAVAREGFRTLRLELLAAWERAGGGRQGFEAMGVAYVRFAVGASGALPRDVRRIPLGTRVPIRSSMAEAAGAFRSSSMPWSRSSRPGWCAATIRCSSRASSGRSCTASPGWRSMASCAVRRPKPRRSTRYAVDRACTGIGFAAELISFSFYLPIHRTEANLGRISCCLRPWDCPMSNRREFLRFLAASPLLGALPAGLPDLRPGARANRGLHHLQSSSRR